LRFNWLSVTAWRQTRLFSNSANAEKILEQIGDDHLKDLISADEGDWEASSNFPVTQQPQERISR